MIEPKEIEVLDAAGLPHKFIISKIPYASGGREVTLNYLPTLYSNYEYNENLTWTMFKHVQVVSERGTFNLETKELINNFVTDPVLGKNLSYAMLEYNSAFLLAGSLLSSLMDALPAEVKQLISKTLTVLPDFLSRKEEQPLKNSKKTTQ